MTYTHEIETGDVLMIFSVDVDTDRGSGEPRGTVTRLEIRKFGSPPMVLESESVIYRVAHVAACDAVEACEEDHRQYLAHLEEERVRGELHDN